MNIYDIARISGVSPATVSRVINNSPNVRPAKREQVMEVLRKHNYVPSIHAKSLAGTSTKTVAVLTEDIRHINYSTIAYEVEQQASALGYNVFLCNTSRDPDKQRMHLSIMGSKKVDCLILLGAAFCNDTVYKELDETFPATPTVLFNCLYEGPQAYHVFGCMESGILKSLEYLYSLGHRRIAYIQDDDIWNTSRACQAFREKAKELNLEITKHSVFQTRSGYESGIAAVNYFTENKVDYTAVMGCDDITAIGIIKQLGVMGRKVPDDVSIIGRYNSIYAKISTPALTTSDNRISKIAQTIGEIMNYALMKRTTPRKTYIEPILLIRDSTRPPRGAGII